MADRLVPGMVSVTFRALSVAEVVSLAEKAGLGSIEWGGDVHVPHGDIRAAMAASRLCRDAGLSISAYGSYFRAGVRDVPNPRFEQVLDTAVALGAPRIRVWAGNRGSALASIDDRKRVVDDLQAICAAAAAAGVSVGTEFHEGTLTDNPQSAVSIRQQVSAANLYCNWQPRVGLSVDVGLMDLQTLQPHLGDVHVFHLLQDGSRLPLREGLQFWDSYLTVIAQGDRVRRHASLEFVKGDDPEQFLQDARVLHDIIRRVAERADPL